MLRLVCKGIATMITLTWIPDWKAYSVRHNGRIVGMVRFRYPIPFRQRPEFA